MKNLFNLLVGFLIMTAFGCSGNQANHNNKDSTALPPQSVTDKTVTDAEFNAITIDSQRISKDTYDFRLLYDVNGEKKEVYRLRNQDYSVEFKKKFINTPLDYVCYEVADLPTGLTWNVFFDNKSKSFFITEHYDIHAVGDTLDRATVNFDKKMAIVVSGDKGNRYNISLNKLWPK